MYYIYIFTHYKYLLFHKLSSLPQLFTIFSFTFIIFSGPKTEISKFSNIFTLILKNSIFLNSIIQFFNEIETMSNYLPIAIVILKF